jgi:predicted DCC family thiol-disulfide oxidoreductase YuxK
MNGNPVILFDGLCNLCNRSVQFILQREKDDALRFASLQSATGQELLKKNGLPLTDINTFVFIENGRAYTRSTAALRVCRRLKGPWPLLYGFMIVPGFLRNGVYDLVARKRYKWFGKRQECMVPAPRWQARFLE